jgi:hypothetical protein
MRSTRNVFQFGAMALVLATSGCAGSGASAPGGSSALGAFAAAKSDGKTNVTGTYSGTLQDSVAGLEAGSFQLVQYVNSLSGTGVVVTAGGIVNVDVNGTVDGKTITGTVTDETNGCVSDVTLEIAGKKLSGKYQATGSCTGSGTVSIELVPSNFSASGKYSGSLVDESLGQTASIKLDLTQTGSSLSATFTDKTTFGKGSGTASGSISNAVATLSVSPVGDPCAPYAMTAIAYSKGIYGYYSSTVSGCNNVGYLTAKE